MSKNIGPGNYNQFRLMMKQGGDSEVPKSPPYYRLIYSDEGVIPLRLPARLLTGTDFQQHISGLGNIWETFRACTAHSANFACKINE